MNKWKGEFMLKSLNERNQDYTILSKHILERNLRIEDDHPFILFAYLAPMLGAIVAVIIYSILST